MTDYLYPTPFPREPVESSPGKFPSVGVGASICRHERLDAILAVGGECAEDFACRVAERFRSQDPSGRGAGVVHLPL